MEDETKSITEVVAEIADFANAIASLVVGHRRILVEGDFDINLADSMAAELHAKLLGLVHHWETEDEDLDYLIDGAYGIDEDGD